MPGPHALQRPLRCVLEGAHSTCWGDNANILGFNNLTPIGVGLKLDSSAYDVFVTGFAIGLAVSF